MGEGQMVDATAADAPVVFEVPSDEVPGDEVPGAEAEPPSAADFADPVGRTIFHIPWIGRRVRALYEDRRAEEYTWRVEWLGRTRTLSPETAEDIAPVVARAVAVIQSYSAWASLAYASRELLLDRVVWTGAAASVAFPLFWPGAPLLHDLGGALIAVALWLGLTLLGGTLLNLRNASLGFSLAVAAFAAAALGAANAPDGPLWLARGLGFGLIAGAVTVVALALFFTFAIWSEIFIWRWKSARRPEEELLNTLLWNLRFTESQLIEPGDDLMWPESDYRRALGSELEYLATLMERGLPRMLGIRSSRTDAWLQHEAGLRAAVVRRHGRAVLLGSQAALEDLVVYLGAALAAGGRGEWGALEAADELDSADRERRPVTILRRAVAAVLPLAVVVVMTQLDLAVSAEATATLTAPALGWLVLQLLTWTNPKEVAHGSAEKSLPSWPRL